MQTSKWGSPGWSFLHCLPFCSSDQWTEIETKDWLEFFDLLQLILPCKYCRESYRHFIKEDPLGRAIADPSFKGHCRLALARWLWALHNKVNAKLTKPQCEEFAEKCCALNQNAAQWEDSFWYFILTILWNFKEEPWRIDAYRRFFHLLPRVLETTPLGQRLTKCLSRNTLSESDLVSLATIKQWGWKLWSNCHQSPLNFVDFQAMDAHFEGWRSKTCSTAAIPVDGKPGTC